MNAGVSLKLRIVVLAAGFSTRLGQSKPLARVRGISLLRRTLQATAGLGHYPVYVVVPRATAGLTHEARRFNASMIANRSRGSGLSSSVRLGIGAKGSWSAVLLLPVDLAYLRRRDLQKLITYWRGHRRQVVARCVGRRGATAFGGTPLILPRRLKAQALMIAGDSGLRQLLKNLPETQWRLIDLPGAVFDIDSPEDLSVARRRVGASHALRS